MGIYPEKIAALANSPKRARKPEKFNAEGVAAGFECGCFARLCLDIDANDKRILDAGYQTNGCGFAVAAAECLSSELVGRNLTTLRGGCELSDSGDFIREFPKNRTHCRRIFDDALKSALADFRTRQIDDAGGEDALVCSCFGVTEGVLNRAINSSIADTVEEVGAICRAGTGCGSCRVGIEEMIDRASDFG